ncbi:unnamed protein product, partial [Ectocarpus sp. 12 AP-2014]
LVRFIPPASSGRRTNRALFLRRLIIITAIPTPCSPTTFAICLDRGCISSATAALHVVVIIIALHALVHAVFASRASRPSPTGETAPPGPGILAAPTCLLFNVPALCSAFRYAVRVTPAAAAGTAAFASITLAVHIDRAPRATVDDMTASVVAVTIDAPAVRPHGLIVTPLLP